MGAILNGQMQQNFTPMLAHFSSSAQRLPGGTSPVNLLLTPSLRAALTPALLEQLRGAFAQSLFWVFLSMLAMALLGLLLMFWFPAVSLESAPLKPEKEQQPEQSKPVRTKTMQTGASR